MQMSRGRGEGPELVREKGAGLGAAERRPNARGGGGRASPGEDRSARRGIPVRPVVADS